MGFDLYGVCPTINKDYPKKYYNLLKKYGNGDSLDWNKATKKVRKEYFDFQNKYQEDNQGTYFRNNVWWWRPLWQFVCEQCQEFLTVADMNGGNSNDGYKITKTKSIKIAKRLSKVLAGTFVDEVDREHSLRAAKAKVDNEQLKEQMDAIHKEVNKNHVGNSIVPANYPKPYYKKWKKLQDAHNWDGDYPFDKENIENFAKFCRDSGGFEIC